MKPISHRGQEAVVASVVFSALATISVILRIYTRLVIVRCLGVEDYLVTLAMLCSIGLTICIGIQAEYGMGQHIGSVTADDMRKSLKAFWASLIVYYLSLGLTKSSIIILYWRVFPTKGFRIACLTTLSVVVAYTIRTVFGSIFACIPVQAFWTKTSARCINQFIMWFTNAAINIVTDFAIIILPMSVIRGLKLVRAQKQVLVVLFALGGFVCIVSIVRLQSLVAISNSDDPTYDNPSAAMWSSIEANVGIFCSCLPCLRPLLKRHLPAACASAVQKYSPKIQFAKRRSRKEHSRWPGKLLDILESKQEATGPESPRDNGHDRIQLVTVVDVQINKSRRHSKAGSEDDQEFDNNRRSDERLVKDAGNMV